MLNLPDITSNFTIKTIFLAAVNALEMLYEKFVGEF